MKKIMCVILSILMLVLFASCGDTQSGTNVVSNDTSVATDDVDVDLTAMSSTAVYAEVYNMVSSPSDYYGKKVRMKGAFSIYEDESTGKRYYACIIADATACCSQGLEFVLSGDYTYPNDYPELGTDITVTGVFETYDEYGNTYCQLADAVMA